MTTKPHSDIRTFVPNRPALGYTPASDADVIEEVERSIGHVLRDMRAAGRFPQVNLMSRQGRLLLRIVLSRVSIALPVATVEAGWVLLGRALEFETMAPATAPQLHNCDFDVVASEAA